MTTLTSNLWTKAERDGICDVVLMSETKPNELHRAKRTVDALEKALREEHENAISDAGDEGLRDTWPTWQAHYVAWPDCESCALLAALEAK